MGDESPTLCCRYQKMPPFDGIIGKLSAKLKGVSLLPVKMQRHRPPAGRARAGFEYSSAAGLFSRLD